VNALNGNGFLMIAPVDGNVLEGMKPIELAWLLLRRLSECHSQSELDLPLVEARTRDPGKVRAAYCAIRLSEVRMVREIEELRPKIGFDPLGGTE
jgi:hypothetical protein